MPELHAEERTRPFIALTALTLSAALGLLLWRAELIVPPWVIVAIGAPWVAFSVLLRVRRHDWGREGKYVDLWSIPHFVGGGLLGLFGIGSLLVLALVVWWELVETGCRIFEHPTNRVMDVVLAMAAWATAQALCGGGLPAW